MVLVPRGRAVPGGLRLGADTGGEVWAPGVTGPRPWRRDGGSGREDVRCRDCGCRGLGVRVVSGVRPGVTGGGHELSGD